MTLSASDTVFKDLKEKGLGLSEVATVQIPEPPQTNQGIIRKLSSLVTGKRSSLTSSSTQSPRILQVHYTAFFVIKQNTIFIYKYNFNQQAKNISVQYVSSYTPKYEIEDVYVCSSKYIQDKGFPLLFKVRGGGVVYCNFSLKEFVISEGTAIKVGGFVGAGWISDKECLIINQKQIRLCILNAGTLVQKIILPCQIKLDQKQKIIKSWIYGNVDQHQDTTICICYTTMTTDQNAKNSNMMKLRIKQFIRTLDGDLIRTQPENYLLQTQSLKFYDNFNLTHVGDYFCLQLSNQILVMKKKFGKYMLLDNMLGVMHGYRPVLGKKGLVVSIGEDSLELNCIQFSDPKCTSRICDVIQFPESLIGFHENFVDLWPIINNKTYTIIFVFMKQNQIKLAGLIKQEPMMKMMALAKKYPSDKLSMVQDMAYNLGINQKDFYLKLWSTSKKQNGDIHQYLLPCRDVYSIKKQLKSTLRQRTIQVSKMIQILTKITEINLANLKENLNTKNLQHYLKNDFLIKKISLNQRDKMLDYRIFQGIYNASILDIVYDIARDQLDPIKPKFDPLHSSDNYHPIKELKSLQNVFQEFKVLLLQDYKTFLKQFLKKFPNKILEVLHRFSFLLPNHPFVIAVQKPSKTNQPVLQDPKTNNTQQPLWFHSVKVTQWQKQLTKQRILQELFHDFQTSKIIETIDQFGQSIYAVENKRWKHGLITLSLEQYTEKLNTLNGIQLYLDVCQFANQLQLNSQNGDPKISQKIVNKLKQKNRLTEPDIHYCKLYASMHYFMLKNKIIPRNKLQINYLTSLKPESLIALFFLQNKQRKQHIFNDFMDLYEDKSQFCEVLRRFVESENCSRIELEILMNQVIAKGHQFQEANQDIIHVLIQGICMKVEVRESLLILDIDEEQQDQQAGCLIDHIQLSKDLALKVNRIKRLRLCKNIFNFFGLQKKTYKDLLDLEQDNRIFSLILQKFFQIRQIQDRTEQLRLNIEDEQQINLQNPRNLLTVLIYLQENVYYSAQTFDILLLFGLELILWKQFGIMREIINDQNAFQTLGIERAEFIKVLTIQALQSIYTDPNIIYDQQTKQQIINTLNIDDQITPLKIRQNAKLQLVEIFTNWGLDVHPSDIHAICYQWRQQNRQQFMIDLVDNYVTKLDFKTFEQIFKLLQVTDRQTIQVNIINVEYVKYCDYFAKKLLQQQRYKEVVEIIVFLMGIETTQKIDYAMLIESYLRSIIELYGDNQEKGRKFIQFFVQKYETAEQYSIRQLLQSQFDENVLALWQRVPTITIECKYCFDKFQKVPCEVSLDNLWQIAKTQAGQSITDLYYNYFFLTMGLTNPTKGFGNTLGISYNLEKITNLILGGLAELFDRDQNLWFVNYLLLQAKFLFDAILGQAAFNLQINLDNTDKKTKIQSILKELRQRKNENKRNQVILNIITRLKTQLWNKSKVKTRKDNYLIKLKQINSIQSQRNMRQQQENQNEEQQEKIQEPKVFLNWRKVQQQKKVISSMSQFLMSEKDLIDQVYDKNIEFSRLKENKKVVRPNRFENLFTKPGVSGGVGVSGRQKLDTVAGLIAQRKFEQVGTYSKDLVLQALDKIYVQDQDKNYTQIIQVLEALKLGDPQKRELFKLAKIFLATLPPTVQKSLFSLQFLQTPINYDEQTQKSLALYSQFKPKIQQIIPSLSITQLKQLANLMNVILDSTQFSARVYLLKLLYLGQKCKFDSNSALMAYECVVGMTEYPDIIVRNYQFIIGKMNSDRELKLFVKESLGKIMAEKQYYDIAEEIKKIPVD